MARYYFHITDGSEIPDETGTPLNSVEQARQEALKSASELETAPILGVTQSGQCASLTRQERRSSRCEFR